MSYTTGYFLAILINCFRDLAWMAFIVSVPIVVYLWFRGRDLKSKQANSDEEIRALIDWSSGGGLQIRAYWIISLVTPSLYIMAHLLPNSHDAMELLGFPQSTPCMSSKESGELLSGTSTDIAGYFTFKMKDGVAIMCRVDDMNARGTLQGTQYRVVQGKRVS